MNAFTRSSVPASVVVPGEILWEVLEDGSCPFHLRVLLSQALRGCCESQRDCKPAEGGETLLTTLDQRCLAAVAAHLPLSEVLALRTGSREALQWAMKRPTADEGPLRQVHNRIRTRLWMRRVADLTEGTDDESVFETRLRGYADEALRRRMEAELHEALVNSEQQIRDFQTEVSRRMAEQEERTRSMVEARVQEGLDAIVAVEVAKARAAAEAYAVERVGVVLWREICRTMRGLRAEVAALAAEVLSTRQVFSRDLWSLVEQLREFSGLRARLTEDLLLAAASHHPAEEKQRSHWV